MAIIKFLCSLCAHKGEYGNVASDNRGKIYSNFKCLSVFGILFIGYRMLNFLSYKHNQSTHDVRIGTHRLFTTSHDVVKMSRRHHLCGCCLLVMNGEYICIKCRSDAGTVVPNKSDSDEIFCLQLLSKILLVHSTWANANR